MATSPPYPYDTASGSNSNFTITSYSASAPPLYTSESASCLTSTTYATSTPPSHYSTISTSATPYTPAPTKREDALQQFETGRIKHLQEERLHIQKKTFTKWINSFLNKARQEVVDLFTDLGDGKMLLKLLEIISGEKLGKPNNGRMRVHKVENVNKSLAFLHTKVRLESIGAEDIVDGNPRLILGLVWTIILRFHIQEIEINLDEENESSEKKSAKDALLLWCQRKTAGYSGVQITDFTGSWRNGMGFNALIHAHRSDLLDYNALDSHRHIDNLNHAFAIAHSDLGIARILDAEDVDTSKPDEKSIITYVASYYHTFARMRNEMKGSRRIANIMNHMKDVDDSKARFERITTQLLEWVREKIVQLNDRSFPNSLDGVQKLLIEFKTYRTEEKPPKYMECSEIEALFFSINASLKGLNQPSYIPKDGQLIKDIEREWEKLVKAEHRREVALRDELMRQERLEHLAFKFEKKSVLRKGYLEEMIQVLSDPRYGSNLTQVDATVKKHEAISADIIARRERFEDLTKMNEELHSENYHGKQLISDMEGAIMAKWRNLLDLLDKHKQSLQQASQLMIMLREADTILHTITELKTSFRSEDVGGFLMAVEDLIQKHSLMEIQVHSMGESIKRLSKQGAHFKASANNHKDLPLLDRKLKELNLEYENLVELSAHRKSRLEEARNFYQLQVDLREEEAWVIEKQRICRAAITAKDLRSLMTLQQKHKALEDEMRARRPKSDNVIRSGEELCGAGGPGAASPKAPAIRDGVSSLRREWKTLEDLAAARRKRLANGAEAYSFMGDSNETESWINEKMPLVQSSDFGADEPSAKALLQLNSRLQSEIAVYDADMKQLNDLGKKLIANGITSLNLTSSQDLPEEVTTLESKVVEEIVPQEVWEEVTTEKVEEEVVTEEKLMNIVKSKYPFEGQGMIMVKGEEMLLLGKTNDDWWNVRKMTGEEGFVPANYVKEVESRPIKVKVKRSKKVPVTHRVKKTNMVRVMKEQPQPPPRRRSIEDSDTVERRLSTVNAAFEDLNRLAEQRAHLLNDAIQLLAFNRDCSAFDAWMREREKSLMAPDPPSESVEAAKRKFEQFLTDMSAASGRMDGIERMADAMEKAGHSQLNKVRARLRQIRDQWEHLNLLRQRKERSLEGASSVELFHRTVDEARDWMVEKMEKLDTDDIGRDLKTIQALQRKHDQLERELAPVQDKVNRVKTLATSVKASYPHESEMVEKRQGEILDLWKQLKGKATDRRNRLEEAVGNEIFMDSSKNLLNWVSAVKQDLNADEAARDVSTAERFLESHNDLGDDIRAHRDEFREVNDLGNSLVARNPNLKQVRERLTALAEEEGAINRGWQEKGDWLRQCLDLQLFNREADHIDAATKAHEAFLDYGDLGSTLDDVEALLKRHDDFENTLIAQDERLRTFSEMAQKLIQAQHYDAEAIDHRRKMVLARRHAVKSRALERRSMLDASIAFQQFKADADDFDTWISEKRKLADDESYKDLANLERKLQKHEASQREIRANEGQLRRLNKTGEDLMGMEHYRTKDISQTLEDLNGKWKDLIAKTQERGRKLRQATDQLNYNKHLEDTAKSLDSLENALKKTDVGGDVRSCKDLLCKQRTLESEVQMVETKIRDSTQTGEQMANDGHFDAQNIVNSCQALKKRYDLLEGPSEARRGALEEALRFYEFKFQVEAEKQWIAEHIPAATLEGLGQSLHEAQNLMKKHAKLEAEVSGHAPQIDKTLNKGKQLVDVKHPERLQIETLCQELTKAWDELNALAEERRGKLELNMKAQNYFFEANEVEGWMAEKRNILQTKDYGKDEDVARKKLTKHKALELEIDTYAGLVKEIGATAEAMTKNNHPESKLIKEKQQVINQDMIDLQKLSTHLRQKLLESMYRHEYFREADELEKWIAEQMQTASSDDFGTDYEHLLLLQAKFDDFKRRVESGSERFNQCEELAKKLVAGESPYSAEIDKKKEILGVVWNRLLEVIRERDEKLEAAGEIHRFNRDVSEALSRIQEKFQAIPEGFGRDVNSVQSLIRKHEGFENDLVALEAQLQVLVDDAAQLQQKYPGSNTEHISEQQSLVIENWNTLQEKALQRKKQLLEAEKLQKFLADSRDLMSWSSDLRFSMKTHEKVRDAASAQTLKGDHERLKAEIEAREDVFQRVVDQGETMVDDSHYAEMDIRDRVGKVLEERNQLHAAWQNKKVYLDQLLDLQFFLRDVKQLETLCIAQEASLTSSDCAETIEEVDAQLKKHVAFENVVEAQEEKVEILRLHGAKLIEQNHFYSPNIKTHIDDVITRRSKVKNAATGRHHQLEGAQLFAQFLRDAADASVWIDEKSAFLEVEKQKGEVNSFEEKVKKLQKHQAFMAELQAHESRIQKILDNGQRIMATQQQPSSQVDEQLRDLSGRWNALVEDSQAHFRGLEEAQDILEFNTQVEKVEAWIRDKEMLVQAGDLGRDLEHCQALQRKLEDVDSDMRVDDDRFVKLNQLADKIISQGRSDNQLVQMRRQELNQKWQALKGAIDTYRCELRAAFEMHALSSAADDVRERLAEKSAALSTEEVGRDLAQVEALQRKQESLMRDVTAIEKKIRELRRTGDTLAQAYPARADGIEEKIALVEEEWTRLREAAARRQEALSAAYTLHKFQSDLRELAKWQEAVVTRMEAPPLPMNANEADMRLQEHQEAKAEIDGRKGAFQSLRRFGEKLLQESASATEETIQQSLVNLDEIKENVHQSWEERFRLLSQAHQLQLFLERLESVESWLADKEAFLHNDDIGDSIASVDALDRKHSGFLKIFEAQEDKVDALQSKGEELIAQKHYNSEGIAAKVEEVIEKRDNLKNVARERTLKLAESNSLHQFLRNVYEVEGWISEKMQVACDESYRDPTNLQSKIQRHAAFDAELTANSPRVAAISNEGEELISKGHFAEKDIMNGMERLNDLWKQLLNTSSLKKDRLQEAYQALLFTRTLDDLESWMEEVEGQLESEDHGRDLASVQHLQEKARRLEAEVESHGADATQAQSAAAGFAKAEHFMADALTERVSAVASRYQSLREPLQIRRENLNDSLILQQLLHDMDDELVWVSEKQTQAASPDLGASLLQVQKLQKKHQILEAEIQSHDPVLKNLQTRAQHLVRSGHFASPQIETRLQELLAKMTSLKDDAAVRRLRLLDAVEAQMFYSEVNEADAWMKERNSLLTSADLGKDEASAAALLKKVDNLTRDLENFNAVIEKLQSLCDKMTARNHFDAEYVANKMNEVRSEYDSLRESKERRSQRLTESVKLFAFGRECSDVLEWLGEQTTTAASEDYGHDVEHVEVLIQKFDSFMASLMANGHKVEAVKTHAQALIDDNHSEPERVNEKVAEVLQLWDDLKELSTARQEALAGAKQVHVFDRDADETKTWIWEKVATVTSEDFGHDLESIQMLARKHQGFERDLAAVKEQVENVVSESKRLAALFPDAKEHISVKHEETVEAWNELLEKSAQRKDRLHQAEELQAYFDQYRELMSWLNELLAKITASELSRDVAGCETLITRHGDYKSELDGRVDALAQFSSTGNALVTQGHFMSEEISEKIAALEGRQRFIVETWQARRELYQQNLDLRIFLRDAQLIESWLSSRESVVNDDRLGDSIAEVEDLLRRHDDFLKTIDAQDDKLDPVKRITIIEEDYRAQRQREEDARRAEAQRKEAERLDALKRKEVMRITDARRREDERRRTQEIRLGGKDDGTALSGAANATPTFVLDQDESRDGAGAHDAATPLPDLGSQTSLNSLNRDIKRAESMKVETKKTKRTPSFTTRRHTQSFRRHNQKNTKNLENLEVEIKGYLERKQELQSGGKKATIRSWKTFYSVLCGQLLCFFKDEDDFYDQKAAASPVSIFQAKVDKADDYTKKKHVFRVITRDGAEYLLLAQSESDLVEWVTKLKFHAQLPPAMQLMSYDEHKDSGDIATASSLSVPRRDGQPDEQRTPDSGRHGVASYPHGQGGLDPARPHSQAVDNPLYANINMGGEKVGPPVPPRGGPLAASRSSSQSSHGDDSVAHIYQNRVSVVPSYEEPPPQENIYQNYPNSNGGHRRLSAENIEGSSRNSDSFDGVPGSRQPYSEYTSRTMSLPPGVTPPSQRAVVDHPTAAPSSSTHRHSMTASLDRAESSSEGDNTSATAGSNGKEKKRGSVFKFLRRKGAQV